MAEILGLGLRAKTLLDDSDSWRHLDIMEASRQAYRETSLLSFAINPFCVKPGQRHAIAEVWDLGYNAFAQEESLTHT